MKKVVSVIIPVYNVEEFIFRTVESVMNQDYKNIEIILVDDGSPDNSAKIIDELEDISIWREIFQTHTEAFGKKTKPKTDNQIRKWLKNPHSDSAEYKMWGNGVALPNVVFVLSGIAYYAQNNDG